MRLLILANGHRPLQKIPLALMKAMYGVVPGPVAVMSYRRDLFGKYLADCCQEGMRGGSEWQPAEVELMAAFVSKLNDCRY
jgi:hypothetical protein